MNQSNEYKAQWMQNLVPKTEFIDQKKIKPHTDDIKMTALESLKLLPSFIFFQDSGNGTPVTMRVDSKGFFLYWIDQNNELDILDIATIRDVRTGQYAKKPKVRIRYALQSAIFPANCILQQVALILSIIVSLKCWQLHRVAGSIKNIFLFIYTNWNINFNDSFLNNMSKFLTKTGENNICIMYLYSILSNSLFNSELRQTKTKPFKM